MPRRRVLILALTCLGLPTACLRRPAPPAAPAATLPAGPYLHLGPERTALFYDDPRAEDKRPLFDRINADRAAAGLRPLRYEPRAALVGDAFCLDSALAGTWGHWDGQGRAPYLRWALAGGVDHHVQNVAAFSYSSGRLETPVRDLLLESHAAMMAEQPPNDGHRRTILDPDLTHVGIGVATVGGEFRMTEEFTRVAFEWIEVPAGPLRRGERARFAGRTLPDWEVGLIEVRFEPPPRPLSRVALRRSGSYRLPPVVRTLRPRLPAGALYDTGGTGEFTEKDGLLEVAFPLEEAGHHFVVCYLRRKGGAHEAMSPGSTALVTALD